MSTVGTVRDGIRDNPLRIVVLVRSSLVVLIGLPLALDFLPRALSRPQEGLHLGLGLFAAALVLGLVAEFVSYPLARVINPAAYAGYVVLLAFTPLEHPILVAWWGAMALLAVLLSVLYYFTTPARLAAADAA